MSARHRLCLAAIIIPFLFANPADATTDSTDWSWVSLDTEGARWATTEGSARVVTRGRKIEIDFFKKGEVACRAIGTTGEPTKLEQWKNAIAKRIRVNVTCTGTEMGTSIFCGEFSALRIGNGMREVITIHDGFNVMAVTHGP